ncbi:MAG: hypothetical protein ACKO3G_06225 [Planctomycetaceae bacterium]
MFVHHPETGRVPVPVMDIPDARPAAVPPGPSHTEGAMDRDTLETLCRSFAARQTQGRTGDEDPVAEIMRSFRLAEISVAEMQSLLGLVADADDASGIDGLAGIPADLDGPPAIVDDFPDFDDVVAAGIVDDDESAIIPGAAAVVDVRVTPSLPGVAVGRGRPAAG